MRDFGHFWLGADLYLRKRYVVSLNQLLSITTPICLSFLQLTLTTIMTPRTTRSTATDDDTSVHQTRHRTKMNAVQDEQASTRGTKTSCGGKGSRPSTSKRGGTGVGMGNTKSGGSGGTKGSAAGRKQKQRIGADPRNLTWADGTFSRSFYFLDDRFTLLCKMLRSSGTPTYQSSDGILPKAWVQKEMGGRLISRLRRN